MVNVPVLPYNVDNISESSRSINRGNLTPTSINDDPTFWVPSKQSCQGANAVSSAGTCQKTQYIQSQIHLNDFVADESPPVTPTSPSGSNRSVTLSTGSGTIPIARSEKHMVLAMNPTRPKVASMTAKLDHTKFDTSLYQSVSEIKFKGRMQLTYNPLHYKRFGF